MAKKKETTLTFSTREVSRPLISNTVSNPVLLCGSTALPPPPEKKGRKQ